MTPKTREQYFDQIREILDEASGDDSLTPQDYQALCQDITDNCNDRANAIDLDEIEEDDDIDPEELARAARGK